MIDEAHLLKREVFTHLYTLAHHARLAGSNTNLFSDEAVFAIHQNSEGLLRKANFLAKAALLAASMDETQSVAPEHVRMASTDWFVSDRRRSCAPALGFPSRQSLFEPRS